MGAAGGGSPAGERVARAKRASQVGGKSVKGKKGAQVRAATRRASLPSQDVLAKPSVRQERLADASRRVSVSLEQLRDEDLEDLAMVMAASGTATGPASHRDVADILKGRGARSEGLSGFAPPNRFQGEMVQDIIETDETFVEDYDTKGKTVP